MRGMLHLILVMAALIAPAPDDLLECVAVSAKLNNPRYDGPDVQEPLSD